MADKLLFTALDEIALEGADGARACAVSRFCLRSATRAPENLFFLFLEGCSASALWKLLANATSIQADAHIKAAVWKSLLGVAERGDLTFVRVEAAQGAAAPAAAQG